MSKILQLLTEMEREAQTTRKMLERVPVEKFSWKPHEKSMSLRQLSTHVAELPSWVSITLRTSGMDFAKDPYNPPVLNSSEDLMKFFESSYHDGHAELEKATESDLDPTWTLRNGDEVYSTEKKDDVIRMTYCQIVHHRAQLGVYLRLLDIPIPGTYGPSADDLNLN